MTSWRNLSQLGRRDSRRGRKGLMGLGTQWTPCPSQGLLSGENYGIQVESGLRKFLVRFNFYKFV
jgi:hypothetical protein